jgi:hypothetical protein
MYVLVLRPRLRRAVDDTEARQIFETLIRLYAGSGGLRSLYGVRLSDQELITITLWDSREEAEGGFAAGRPQMAAAHAEVLDGPPERTAGELLLGYEASQDTATD